MEDMKEEAVVAKVKSEGGFNIKRAWAKITMACLCLVAAVACSIAMFWGATDGVSARVAFGELAPMAAMTTFFFGMCVVFVCKLLGEDLMRLVASWALLATGAIATVLILTGYLLTLPGSGWGFGNVWYDLTARLIAPLVVFGLIPIIRAVKKILFEDVRKNTI